MVTAVCSKNPVALFGIPLLPRDALKSSKDKHFPIPDDTDEDDYFCAEVVQNMKFAKFLGELCDTAWPVTSGAKVRLAYSKNRRFLMLALIASTRRNDQLVPQDGSLEKVKEIMTKEGFHEEPSWFQMVIN